MNKSNENKPIVIKAGRGIRAKLWLNKNQNGQWFNITISRLYKDSDDQFQESDSFSRDDLLQVSYIAQQAFDHIVNQDAEPPRER